MSQLLMYYTTNDEFKAIVYPIPTLNNHTFKSRRVTFSLEFKDPKKIKSIKIFRMILDINLLEISNLKYTKTIYNIQISNDKN